MVELSPDTSPDLGEFVTDARLLDLNGDEVVSAEEGASLDTNGDGVVDGDEWTSSPRLFAKLDVDASETLDAAELAALQEQKAVRANRPVRGVVAEFDIDQDGQIS